MRPKRKKSSLPDRIDRAYQRKLAMEADCYKRGKMDNWYGPPFMPYRTYEESLLALRAELAQARRDYEKTYNPKHFSACNKERWEKKWEKHKLYLKYQRAVNELYNHFKLINFHIKNLESQFVREIKILKSCNK